MKNKKKIALAIICIATSLYMVKLGVLDTKDVKADNATRITEIAQIPELVPKAENKTSTSNNKANLFKTPPQAAESKTAVVKTVQSQPVRQQNVDPVKRSTTEISRGGSRTLYMVATGYTDAPEENYPYAGQPSYIGMPLQRGVVAVDPHVIPMGTMLFIEGYGEAIAADQGGAIKGNRIDLFFDSKGEANTWGMRTVKVIVNN